MGVRTEMEFLVRGRSGQARRWRVKGLDWLLAEQFVDTVSSVYGFLLIFHQLLHQYIPVNVDKTYQRTSSEGRYVVVELDHAPKWGMRLPLGLCY
jgi:hypothetical protein